jgi:hypothetical protein
MPTHHSTEHPTFFAAYLIAKCKPFHITDTSASDVETNGAGRNQCTVVAAHVIPIL